MNDVRIGIGPITIANFQQRTHQDMAQEQNGCRGVVLGASVLPTGAWSTATSTLQLMGAMTAVFDVCQD